MDGENRGKQEKISHKFPVGIVGIVGIVGRMAG